MKMEPIEGSETSAFKTHTPGKYPKENILLFIIIIIIIIIIREELVISVGTHSTCVKVPSEQPQSFASSPYL
jgi:hypothetical protein